MRAVAFDQLERTARIVLDEVPVGSAEFSDQLRAEATARQPDAIDAVDTGTIPNGLRKRQRIARDDGLATDKRVLADAAELMHAGVGADHREVFHRHVPAKRRGITEDRRV